MAAQTALPDILSNFKTATETTYQSLPAGDALIPQENGITLLDAKNELFLSYLEALALRNLNVIRALKDGKDHDDVQKLNDKITRKLVEHRVYLERGVRPLEGKIKYQVDKVVKAAEDEERAKRLKPDGTAKANGHKRKNGTDESESGSSSDEDEDSDDPDDAEQARPNAASLNRNARDTAEVERRAQSKEDGVYRPPRVSATSMPAPATREERRPQRSRTLDEYVSTELSAAPAAEPSIGSTITAGGRQNKDARQLAREQERRNYEETNLVRLPKESKKELGRMKGRDRQRDGGGFGGEEWRDLGASVDRIGDLTKRKGRGGASGALERSRKRTSTEDGQRGDGIGDAFETKRRRVMKKSR